PMWPADLAAWSCRCVAPGRGWCRCWPATRTGCWQQPRAPGQARGPGGTGLPRLATSRLRATWLAEAAQMAGLATFMHAAGITCSQRLGDITAILDPGSEADAV